MVTTLITTTTEKQELKMRKKGQGTKQFVVVRQQYDIKPWNGQPDEPIVSLKMTEKQAVEAVLYYERLGYFKVDYRKVGDQ